MSFPEIWPIRSIASTMAGSSWMQRYLITYDQCRLDQEFSCYIYSSGLIAGLAFVLTLVACGLLYVLKWQAGDTQYMIGILALPGAALVASIIFFCRLYWISSLRDFRGALIDVNAIHAVGMMLAMTGYNVPLIRIFRSLSNLGSVYGQDIALEATYILSLVEEDGMDLISAMRKAQSTSPSALWKELLIGITAIYSSGGSLRDYLQGRYESLAERKVLGVRKYNETLQGISSIYLSIIGIGAIFVAIINLVFSMAGMLGGDALVWIDAIVIVPLGSMIIIKALQAANPEAVPR